MNRRDLAKVVAGMAGMIAAGAAGHQLGRVQSAPEPDRSGGDMRPAMLRPTRMPRRPGRGARSSCLSIPGSPRSI
jgi:hypothetical protein